MSSALPFDLVLTLIDSATVLVMALKGGKLSTRDPTTLLTNPGDASEAAEWLEILLRVIYRGISSSSDPVVSPPGCDHRLCLVSCLLYARSTKLATLLIGGVETILAPRTSRGNAYLLTTGKAIATSSKLLSLHCGLFNT